MRKTLIFGLLFCFLASSSISVTYDSWDDVVIDITGEDITEGFDNLASLLDAAVENERRGPAGGDLSTNEVDVLSTLIDCGDNGIRTVGDCRDIRGPFDDSPVELFSNSDDIEIRDSYEIDDQPVQSSSLEENDLYLEYDGRDGIGQQDEDVTLTINERGEDVTFKAKDFPDSLKLEGNGELIKQKIYCEGRYCTMTVGVREDLNYRLIAEKSGKKVSKEIDFSIQAPETENGDESDSDDGKNPECSYDPIPSGESTTGTFKLNTKAFEYKFTEEPDQPADCDGFEVDKVKFNVQIKSEDADLSKGDYEIALSRKRPEDYSWGPVRINGITEAVSKCDAGSSDKCVALIEPASIDVSGMNDRENLQLGFTLRALDPEKEADRTFVGPEEVSRKYEK